MALEKHVIDIPLAKGVDESVDAVNLNSPALIKAENAIFTKDGALRKRRGFSSLPGSALPTGTDSLNRVFDHQGYPVIYGRGSVESYSQAKNTWYEADNVNSYPCELAYRHGFDAVATVDTYDAAVDPTSDVFMEAWIADGACWYRITDFGTGAMITAPTVIEDIVEQVQVVYNSTSLGFSVLGISSAGALLTTFFPASTLVQGTMNTSVAATVLTYSVKSADDEDQLFVAFSQIGALWTVRLLSAGTVDVAAVNTATVCDDTCDIWYDSATKKVYSIGTDLTTKIAYLVKQANDLTGTAIGGTAIASVHATVNATTCAITVTEDGGVWAAASFVDTAVVVAQGSTGIVTSLPATTSTYFYSHTTWRLFDTSLVPASDNHFIPWYVLTSQFEKTVGREPVVTLGHYRGESLPNDFGATQTQGAVNRHALLVTVDMSTFSRTEYVPTADLAAPPIVVAKFNTDTHDVLTSLSKTRVHLSKTAPANQTLVAPSLIMTGFITRDGSNEGTGAEAWDRTLTEWDIEAGGTGSLYGAFSPTSGDDRFVIGTRVYDIDLDPPPVRVITGEGTSYINGGYLQAFDGATLAETAIFEQPSVISVTSVKDVTANFAGSTQTSPTPSDFSWFYFRAVILIRDANGIEHRSAPSNPFRFGQSGLVADTPAKLTIVVAKPGITHWRSDRGSTLICQIYMSDYSTGDFPVTEFGIDSSSPGGPYRLIREWNIDPTSTFTTQMLWDGLDPDFAHTEHKPLLYTEGGVLDAQSPPALLDIVRLPNKVVGINAENPFQIMSTKRESFGQSPEWNGNLATTLSPATTFVSLAAMDDKVLAFSADHVYILPDSNVDAAGKGAIPAPQLLSSDTGCVNKRTVVEGPFGVIFQGARGFYKVSRGTSLSYIGGPVEDTLEGETITSAVLVPRDQVVRFASEEGTLYSYDYERNNWSTREVFFDTAAMVDGTYTYAKNTALGWAGAEERALTDVSYTDVGTTLAAAAVDTNLDIETAWIKLAGLQGYQRVRKIRLLARVLDIDPASAVSPGGLTIKVAYDYDDTWVDSFVTTFALSTYSEGDPLFIQVRPSRQKCTAIKIGIVETNPTGIGEGAPPPLYSEGYSISGLALEVGLKKGTHKDVLIRR